MNICSLLIRPSAALILRTFVNWAPKYCEVRIIILERSTMVRRCERQEIGDDFLKCSSCHGVRDDKKYKTCSNCRLRIKREKIPPTPDMFEMKECSCCKKLMTVLKTGTTCVECRERGERYRQKKRNGEDTKRGPYKKKNKKEVKCQNNISIH
jgi:hypothetical protein